MLEFLPVTAERAADLERFSVRHGKFRYCSCMRWRMTAGEYKASTKESRIAALAGLAQAGAPVGMLAETQFAQHSIDQAHDTWQRTHELYAAQRRLTNATRVKRRLEALPPSAVIQ